MLLVSEVLKSGVSSCIPPLRQGAVIMRSNSQQLTVDRLFREPSIEDVRHMTASPETGPVVLSTAVLSAPGHTPANPRRDIQKVSFDGSIQV